MARLIPPIISPQTRSNAERSLFSLFESSLPHTWTVLHSLGVASHKVKPWAEIDFVLIGPPGIFCLEVKGGRVRREAGMWVFINANDEASWKHEGPFAQVGGAAAALYRFLHDGEVLFRGMVAKGVMFPDITFQLEGPDIDLSIVYDVRDAASDLRSYLRRIGDRARSKHTPTESELTIARCNRIADVLRGDFDFRPSLHRRAGLINKELISLTSEQYKALDMFEENAKLLVEGAAGTGKTLLAVEEARRNARLGRKTLLCCFSRNLSDFLADTVRDEPLITVDSFHRLMLKWIRQANMVDSLPDASEDYLYEVAFPSICFEAISTLDDFRPFETLIVDEAQDLMLSAYWDVFDVLLMGGLSKGHLRVFFDPKQNLFDGVDGVLPELIAKIAPARCKLSVNCRNTQPTSINGELICGLTLGRVAKASGPESIIEFFKDQKDQGFKLNKLVRNLQSDGLKPDQIVILSPRAFKSSGISALGSAFRVHDISEGARRIENSISFCTVAGFKGLEADVVVIIDLFGLHGAKQASLLYVAVTRPRVLLVAFLHDHARRDFEENARELGKALVS